MLDRVWGRRGELTGFSQTSGVDRFGGIEQVYIFQAGTSSECPLVLGLEAVWQHRGQLVFKFRGIDSISDAEPLEGGEVRLPAELRAPLEAGQYYQSDLVGCEVVERATGTRLGVVAEFQEFGGTPLLLVKDGAETEPIMIPFARSICVEIDPANRRIGVDLPQGLKEINAR